SPYKLQRQSFLVRGLCRDKGICDQKLTLGLKSKSHQNSSLPALFWQLRIYLYRNDCSSLSRRRHHYIATNGDVDIFNSQNIGFMESFECFEYCNNKGDAIHSHGCPEIKPEGRNVMILLLIIVQRLKTGIVKGLLRILLVLVDLVNGKQIQIIARNTIMASSYGSRITNIRFNQDKSCFICCMDNGLRIYYIEPLVEKVHYDERAIGGVGFCEMLWRSNLFAIVSGGSKPKYAENSVLVFDDSRKRAVLEFTFNLPVLSLFTIETRSNPLGLCELSPGNHVLLVFPGSKMGSLQFLNLATAEPTVSSSPVTINAHQGELACIAINQQGNLIATASDKGTLIRVWDAQKRLPINELRRGTDPATIFCINFSPDSDFLCCSSDKGTIHIFALKNQKLNKRSTFYKMSFLGHYVDSQWALANFTVPPECACVCAFSSNSSVVAICIDGTYHKYFFNEDGVCSRLSYDVFLEVFGDDF
ncbi:unnamed protein product, partial [Allacma fusca]